MLKLITSTFLLTFFCIVNATQQRLEPSIKSYSDDVQNCDFAMKKKLLNFKHLRKNSIINVELPGCYSPMKKGEFLTFNHLANNKTYIVSIKQLEELLPLLNKEGGRIIDYIWIEKGGNPLLLDRTGDKCTLPSVTFEATGGDSYTFSKILPEEGVIAVRRGCLKKQWYNP